MTHSRYAGAARGASVYNLSFGALNPVATLTLQNSILYGAGTAPDLYNHQVTGTATVVATAPSIVRSQMNQGGTVSGAGLHQVDPQLGPPTDNGGLTPTRAPQAGSPAVGAANLALCTQAPISGVDQRGQPRRPCHCSLGAVETEQRRCNATPCATAGECVSGLCTDGVCCATACGGSDPGDCQACSVAAGATADGTCSLLPTCRTCRAAAGECDVAESCSGQDPACPADTFAPAGQLCRPSTSVYDPAESCDGQKAACSDDVSGVSVPRGAGGGFAVGCSLVPRGTGAASPAAAAALGLWLLGLRARRGGRRSTRAGRSY